MALVNSALCNLSKAKSEVVLMDEDYISLAEYAAAEVRRYTSDLSLWSRLLSKHGIEVFERKSELPGATEPMLLLITDLPCSIERAEKLVSPWRAYPESTARPWDQTIERAERIKSWPEKEVHLVRHLIKKQYILSARESIDVVKVVRGGNEILVGATGASHADYPPLKGYVRTHQYLSGCLLRESDDDMERTSLCVLFHADLKLPVPRVVGNVLAKFKPNLMVKKAKILREAVRKCDI